MPILILGSHHPDCTLHGLELSTELPVGESVFAYAQVTLRDGFLGFLGVGIGDRHFRQGVKHHLQLSSFKHD
jgi:hypothetical protein